MPTDWRTLPAGRELDALVADRLMGWTQYRDDPWPGSYGKRPDMSIDLWPVPTYSTDIAAAWQVAAKLPEGAQLTWPHVALGGEFIMALPWDSGRQVVERAETAEIAICRAALAWAEAKEQTDVN